MRSALSYQARRHPLIFGVAALLLGPYILAFTLLFFALFLVAAGLDVITHWGK